MTSSQSQDLVVSDLNSIPLTNAISFDYLRNTDVKVKVGTTESNQVQRTYNVEWTITPDKKVQLIASVFPSTGTYKVSIYRETDASTPTHSFQAGSSIRADDLNNVNKQTLFVADEVRETLNSLALGSNPTGNQILLDGARIADQSIDSAKLKNPAVDTIDIIDLAVETNKIDNQAVTTGKIADNAVTDAKLSTISGTKISPDFGSQNITTTGTITTTGNRIYLQGSDPALDFTDDNNNSDFRLQNDNGTLKVKDQSNSNAVRFSVDSSGTVDVAGNLDVGAGADITGNLDVSSGNVTVSGNATFNNGISTNGKDVYTGNAAFIASDTAGAFADRTGNNIDHIWHDESDNAWHFVSDDPYKATGNSKVRAGSFYGDGSTLSGLGNVKQIGKATSTGESSTNSTVYSDKVTLSVSTVSATRVMIFFGFEMKHSSSNNARVYVQVTGSNDSPVSGDQEFSQTGNGYSQYSGQMFDNGSHSGTRTYRIQFRRSSNTGYIKNAYLVAIAFNI